MKANDLYNAYATQFTGTPGNYGISTPMGNFAASQLDQNYITEEQQKALDYARSNYDALKGQADWSPDPRPSFNPNMQSYGERWLSGGKTPAQFGSFEEWFPNTGYAKTIGATIPVEAMRQAGLRDSYEQQRGDLHTQMVAQERNSSRPWYRSATKTAVPLAIGTIGGALGGQALGLGTLTSLGSALSSGASTAAPAATSASASSALGGLGSSLGNFSTQAALGGAARGGISGFLSGGGFGDALKGAALGGVTGGYGQGIAEGLGLQGAGSAAFQGGLVGASGGLASGDLKGAGLGAALGAAGGYLSSGGEVPGLGSLDEKLGPGIQGPTRQGTGILGGLQNLGGQASEGLSGLTGGNTNMLGNALKIGGSIYEDSATRKNNERIRQELLAAQGRAQEQLSPYLQAGADATGRLSSALASGFEPGDLTQDPGYQFRLQEGNKALERRMAAAGLGQSGAALKAAQEYGQGLADQTYNDAFQRYQATNAQNLALSGQGQGAAGSAAALEGDIGNINAQLLAANQQSKNNRLASILGGIGAFF